MAQINQLFSNLLDNALKYLDPDRPGTIRISCKEEAGQIVYCVEDNGTGIAAKYQDRIFEIFHRIDPMNASGDGLGLTIVQNHIMHLGGRIELNSVLNQGTTVTVYIPLSREGDNDDG